MKKMTVNELKARCLVALNAQSSTAHEAYLDYLEAREGSDQWWIDHTNKWFTEEVEKERAMRDVYIFMFEEEPPIGFYDTKQAIKSLQNS